jgi:hypothetical protein
MNDDRLERDIRAALLLDNPGLVPARLRASVTAVPDETELPRGFGRLHVPSFSRTLQALEAIAAVVVVGALIAATLFLRGSSGPVVGASSSASGSATAKATPTDALKSDVPTPSRPADRSTSPGTRWTGLSWSAPSVIPDASTIDDIVAWNGQYVAAGRRGLNNSSGGQLPVGIWRSTDGTTWSGVNTDGASFVNANIAGLVATPAALVAWGSAGDPTCTGEGEGMTCGPMPVMIWTSPNGSDWTPVSDLSVFKDATIRGIAYGSQGLLAVGDTGFGNPAVWASPTGSSWQRQTLDFAVFEAAHFSSIRATASGYAVGGSTGGTEPASGGVQIPSTGVAAAWWSDGQAWHKATVNRADGVGTSLEAIYVGANGMLAIGSASGGKVGTAWNSTDGRLWQPIAGAPSPATLPSFTVADDGSHLVAMGEGAQHQLRMWVSDDGATWKELLFSSATGPNPGGNVTGMGLAQLFVVPGGVIVTRSITSGTSQVISVSLATAQS